jgi:two-component system response regulator GlrR
VLSPSDIIPLALTAQALREKPAQIPSLDEAKQAFERRYLIGVLRAAEGNITTAARMAGRNRTEFYKLLGRHNLDPTRFRQRAPGKDRKDPEAAPGGARQEQA